MYLLKGKDKLASYNITDVMTHTIKVIKVYDTQNISY